MRFRHSTGTVRPRPSEIGRPGGNRNAREALPPERVDQAAGKTAPGPAPAAVAERNFGSMANPLANGVQRARQRPAWPFNGSAPPAAGNGHPAGTNGNGNGAAPGGGGWSEPQASGTAQAYFGNFATGAGPAVPAAAPAVPAAPPVPAPQEPVLGAWAGISAAEPELAEPAGAHILKVLVLDRGGQFSSDLAKASVDLDPAPEILRLARTTQVLEVAMQEEPDVIVVAPAEMSEAGLRRLAHVHREDPRIVIVLSESARELSPSASASCSASEIIPLTPTKAKLRAKLVRALETAEGLRKEHLVVQEHVVVQQVPQPAPPVPSPPPEPRRQEERNLNLARVFTVASASGGCGKTFYSTNLAAYLVRATGGKVLLVDLDLQFGEVAISLHLRPRRTIAELVQEEDLAGALPDYLEEHSAGFKVLCAPKDPVTGDRVGPRETTAVLEAARSRFDYIVVDTPPSLNETCLAAFDHSQSLIIMATMDLPSLKNLRIFLETLKKLSLPADQVALVINKAESGTGIDLKEVEPLYPQGFSAVLPYAKQVSWSINMGVPVLVADPNAEITRKLVAGALKLVPATNPAQLPWSTAEAPARRGWLMRLLKGNAR